MDVHAALRGLLSKRDVKISSPLQFRPGQIFYGTVQKLFPNQLADIRLGAHQLIAKLEVPLKKGEGYWLQVSSSDGEPRLKLLHASSSAVPKEDGAAALIKQLGIPNEKMNHIVARFMMNEQLPLSKEDINRASILLKQADDIVLGLNTLKMMSEKSIPLNEVIFKSLMVGGKDQSTLSLIQSLQFTISSEKNETTAGKDILALLATWDNDSESTNENQYGRKEALEHIKQALKRTGLFYERSLLDHSFNKGSIHDSLKPLLVKFLDESTGFLSSNSKDIAERLLLRMNGQQLLSFEHGPIQQIIYEVPIQFRGYETELTMQWSGRMMSDGKINPDYCHVIFYLELEHLKDTIIDMNVQNRVVSINIINEFQGMKTIAESMLPALKLGLKDLGYQLSSVHFKEPESTSKLVEKVNDYHRNHSYTGVDIRI